jgi:hypothetical protein
MTYARIPVDRDDADVQIEELLDRIRTLVCDLGVLESDGASELELWANRRALQRLRNRLAELVERRP